MSHRAVWILVAALGLPAVTSADDLARRRTEHHLASLRAWYAGDRGEYAFHDGERDRLDLLLVAEKARGQGLDWVARDSFVVRRGLWEKARRAAGSFVPTGSATVHLEMLLEGAGFSSLGEHRLVGVPFRYLVEPGPQKAEGGVR